MAEQVVVGIDVSKAKLDIAILPSDEQFTVSNDRDGISHLVQRLKRLLPTRVVMEATGKLERLAASELAGTLMPVVVVNPRQVRHYPKARGCWKRLCKPASTLIVSVECVAYPGAGSVGDDMIKEPTVTGRNFSFRFKIMPSEGW